MTRVLLVDDEPQMRRAIGVNLVARGYKVDAATSGEDALRLAASAPPDVVLVDLDLPGMDGLGVVRGLRERSDVAIVILAARGAEPDKLAALDAGADDYVTAPFAIEELLARLRAALGRHHPATEPMVVRTTDFTIDLAGGTAWRGGEEVHLAPTEWELLTNFVRNPGRLLTQRWLLERLSDERLGKGPAFLRVAMAGLRRRLEPDPSRPRYFVTDPGMGYRFQPGEGSQAEAAG
jgi:two-component system KDP operon response regulator KdpE